MSCQELLLSTVATLKRVFPAVVVLSIGYRNRLLLAFAKETPAASIRARLNRYKGDAAIIISASRGRPQRKMPSSRCLPELLRSQTTLLLSKKWRGAC
jgi:hypothetical protein